jgi:hypothetical protein
MVVQDGKVSCSFARISVATQLWLDILRGNAEKINASEIITD